MAFRPDFRFDRGETHRALCSWPDLRRCRLRKPLSRPLGSSSMSILINADTKVITQGFTGKHGTFHSEQAIAYGTRVLGGVAGQGRNGPSRVAGVRHGAGSGEGDRRGRDSYLRAGRSRRGRDLRGDRRRDEVIVCITEGVPVLDMLHVKQSLEGRRRLSWLGRTARVMTAGECKIGIMPVSFTRPAGWALFPARARLPMRRCSRRRAWASVRRRRGHRWRPGQRHGVRRRA